MRPIPPAAAGGETAVGNPGSGKVVVWKLTLGWAGRRAVSLSGQSLTVLAARFPSCRPVLPSATLWSQRGMDQPSWQHQAAPGGRSTAGRQPAAGLWERR